MNDDIYAEWIVKRKDTKWKIPAYIGAGVLILLAVILCTRSSWGAVVLVAVCIGLYFARRYLSVEYEYIFVTNELAIDRIYSQESRKTVQQVSMSSVESIEPTVEGRNAAAIEKSGVKFFDYSSGEKDAETYTINFTTNDGPCVLVFEPNDKLLHAMWRCSPSKVHIKK